MKSNLQAHLPTCLPLYLYHIHSTLFEDFIKERYEKSKKGVENGSLKGRSLGAFTRQPKNRKKLVLKMKTEGGWE